MGKTFFEGGIIPTLEFYKVGKKFFIQKSKVPTLQNL
jgi:hypothetical protein